MKSQIWARQYVDLAKLYFGSKSSKVTTTVTSKSNSVTSIESAPVREINNILIWSRAFQLYASIYCQRYPDESSAMFQYMSIIQLIARKLPNWTLYDTKFRSVRAKSNLPWHKVDTVVYFDVTFTENTTPRKSPPSL